MDRPLVILIGGFLGAGKTTLMASACKRLTELGLRVGLVTNDQAANLVDTASLEVTGSPVREVSGGCFCCRFDDLVRALDQLVSEGRPDVLMGEPVGSCTDLSATVMQPIKALPGRRYGLAPSTVLVDPDRVRRFLEPDSSPALLAVFPENVDYIYRKQLEEADFIVLNKIDLLSGEDRERLEVGLRRTFPRSRVMSISAREGTGISDWLDAVTSGQEAGRIVTDVNYEVYAAGEAALGWLNAAYELRAEVAMDWRSYVGTIMSRLRASFREACAEIAHLKIHLNTESGWLVGNLTSGRNDPAVRGEITGSPEVARLTLNVRAHIEPESLRNLVADVLAETAADAIWVSMVRLECFAPARPQPTLRYAEVVACDEP